ncbi:MAG: AAA-like domain-containing protein [Anaerolineae bacterium]|nr:AAA-like domain-containing protein [Anaerolineae bacterium]MDH7475101.1 AAA-like domain-containing protein [Anaerolineae bacterium]
MSIGGDLTVDWVFKARGPLDPERDRAITVEREELREIIRLSTQTTISNYIALLSSRQTGKTTLLYHARAELLAADFAVVLIDLSVLRNQDEAACYGYVSTQIHNALRSRGGEGWPEERPIIKGPVDFLHFLRDSAERTPSPRIIVMLDEVGALLPEVSDSFFNTIRAVFNSAKGTEPIFRKYLFLFCGAVDLYLLTFGLNSPLNICEKIYLKDFSREDVFRLVSNFEHTGARIQDKFADRIYEQARGHPYLTQRICVILERQSLPVLTPAHVDDAVELMLQGDDNLSHIIRQLELDLDAKSLLREIVQQGRQVRFSRNNPIISQLEMIGVIREDTYCQVRNPIYAQVLEPYLRLTTEPKSERRGVMSAIRHWIHPTETTGFETPILEMPPITSGELVLEEEMRCFKTGSPTCPKNPVLDPNQVFIGMPFRPEFADAYKYGVIPALEAVGLYPWRASDAISNIDVMCKVCEGIQSSRYAVINISDWNPNVLFELGLAYGLSKETVIVKDKRSQVPTDLAGMEYIEYASSDELREKLIKFFRWRMRQ